MGRYRASKKNLGQAISIEDALTIMVVIFVIFVLLLIPLVNIDRLKLEAAQKDPMWSLVASWAYNNPQANNAGLEAYNNCFNLQTYDMVLISENGPLNTILIEAFSDYGRNIAIYFHNKEEGTYTAIFVQNFLKSATFRHGNIYWSSAEREWFIHGSIIDYGENPASLKHLQEYRNWLAEERGLK